MGSVASPVHADEDPPNPRLVPPAPLNEQVLHLPAAAGEPADLVVTLYLPPGPGPFPLAVMNHGSNGSEQRPADTPRYRFTMSAYYFLSRGYAVALPMMRGYGGSGGHQGHDGCDLAQMALDNGRDIAAVIADLASNPRIDTQRVVVAGQSFGGWNTLGLGAINPPAAGVRGLIDFFGGVHSSGCDEDMEGESLVDGARRLGAATELPSLWFYGENDSLFGPDIWRPMVRAYTEQGGHAELVDVGSFMEDSHKMLSRPESIPLWVPRVDAFLTRIGLPGRAVFPQYMPRPWPLPSGFALVSDVAAVPWIGESSRNGYRKFLTLKPPRAFVISPGGQSAMAQGGFDPVGRALDMCRGADFTCVPYAIDSDVVFVRPPEAAPPPATRFAAIDDVAAVPWLNAPSRDAYRVFLAHPPPRAFVISEAGGSVGITGPAALTRAMAICAARKVVCYPYAVDRDVVWKARPAPALPRSTGYAAINDVAAVPWLHPKGRELYAHFLTAPLPRAFVVAPGGQAAATQGGYDPLGRALAKCRAAGLVCRPYAVNDEVVWSPPRD